MIHLFFLTQLVAFWTTGAILTDPPQPKASDLVDVKSYVYTVPNGLRTDVYILSQFNISKGWHIYWKNPGSGGYPTTIQSDIKKGLSEEEIKYSVPAVFLEENEIVYGYQNEAWLLKKETIDFNKIPDEINISINYFVCKEICLFGQSDEVVKRPFQTKEKIEKKINVCIDTLFPKNIIGLRGIAASFDGEHFEINFDLSSNGLFKNKKFIFFPDSTPGINFGRSLFKKRKKNYVLTIPVSISPENFLEMKPTIKMLISLEAVDGSPIGFWITMPLDTLGET